jgi:hypothetical protein
MQTGVAMIITHDTKSVEAKHLRVGVNSAMVDNSALAKLMISKGIITEEEYLKAVADEMELEVRRYEDWIERIIGVRPTLA